MAAHQILAALFLSALFVLSALGAPSSAEVRDDIVGPDPMASDLGHSQTIHVEGSAADAPTWIADVLTEWPGVADPSWVVLPHPDPAIASIRWWDEEDVLHEMTPETFRVFDLHNFLEGTFTVGHTGTYGSVWGEGIDGAFDIVDTADGADVIISWALDEHPEHAGEPVLDEDEDPTSGTTIPGPVATVGNLRNHLPQPGHHVR